MTAEPKNFIRCESRAAVQRKGGTVPLLAFLFLPVCLFAALPSAAFALTGDGTADNLYLISSEADLWDLHESVKTNAGAHARLTADITLSLRDSKMWYGMCVDGYSGTFDGGALR